jgi:hypothetical protein
MRSSQSGLDEPQVVDACRGHRRRGVAGGLGVNVLADPERDSDPSDEEPRLTPEQLEAIRKAISNPEYLRQFKIAESAFSSLNRTITSSFVTGIAPALARFREQQRRMAASIAPMIAAQVRTDLVLQPLRNQARAFQSEFAKQLGVSLVASEQIQARIQSLVTAQNSPRRCAGYAGSRRLI